MKQKKAFTIIELMLAMSFLGTMLLGIASLIMQITNIYQKGLAIRGVNTVGREIISDLTRTVQASRVNDLSINPSTQENSNEITEVEVRRARSDYFVEKVKNGKQLGGAFCTGSYSYVWNTADNIRVAKSSEKNIVIKDGKVVNGTSDELKELGVLTIRVKDNNNDDDEVLIVPKLVRFSDYNRDACFHDDNGEMAGNDDSNPIKESATSFDLYDKMKEKDINELIEDNEADLVLYDFTVLPATQNYTTKQIFYPGTFILATYRGGVNITSNGDFCQGSDNESGSMDDEYTGNDFDYCAVNKFNFAARATGETGINQHGDN